VISVGALLLTGIVNTWYLVGTIPALVGTHYGRLLLAKLTLFLIMLCLAAVNRTLLTPRLVHRGAAALTTLRRNALLEIIAGIGIVSIVAALGVTIPGAHQSPVWPFEHTLEWPSAKPGATYVALVALAAMAFAGAATVAAAVRRRRTRLFAGGIAVIAITLAISAWLLAAPAYPTTYASPPLPYATSPIARGATVYAQNCAQCHGEDGRGKGPAADSMAVKPVDLTEHASHHRAGDLYWWIAHGISGTPMPGFGKQLSDDEIWSVVRYLRALSDAAAVEAAADGADFGRWIVAPDFNFEVGAHAQESLAQQRGRHLVLLVLYTLPQSAWRLRVLEAGQRAYVDAGVRVIALPMTPDQQGGAKEDGPDGNSIDALGQADVGKTYGMFARPSESSLSATGSDHDHAEFLIDRSGYLRGRWRGPDVDQRTPNILERVSRLSREPLRPAQTSEHQHSH
jgi:mono/diheme cytochrome c family protein